MTPLQLEPVGRVRGGRTEVCDDDWGGVLAAIELDPERFTEAATVGLESFTHLVVVFHFHLVDPGQIESAARLACGGLDLRPRAAPETTAARRAVQVPVRARASELGPCTSGRPPGNAR